MKLWDFRKQLQLMKSKKRIRNWPSSGIPIKIETINRRQHKDSEKLQKHIKYFQIRVRERLTIRMGMKDPSFQTILKGFISIMPMTFSRIFSSIIRSIMTMMMTSLLVSSEEREKVEKVKVLAAIWVVLENLPVWEVSQCLIMTISLEVDLEVALQVLPSAVIILETHQLCKNP